MNSNTKTILNRDTLQMLVQKHFGEDAILDEVHEITQGWFNAIYILSFKRNGVGECEELVLKTGVQEGKYVLTYEKNIMQTEVLVYDLLSKTIVPVPKILARDFSKTAVDFDYFMMEKLQGDNWNNLQDKITPENEEKLITELARYTATFHQIKGDYFGYIKDDKSFQHSSWREAFHSMVNLAITDGKKGGVDLPYDAILSAFEPLWVLLDDVKEASLVNFDMWTKNILLQEKDGEYYIDGIIDHERAFYGDSYAEFIASNTVCGDVSTHEIFKENYSAVSGKPFTYTRNDRIRMKMYEIYLYVLMGVEVYRYDEKDTIDMLTRCNKGINEKLENLKQYLSNPNII